MLCADMKAPGRPEVAHPRQVLVLCVDNASDICRLSNRGLTERLEELNEGAGGGCNG
ncbi:hypothetical protein GCM10009645_48870 [Mycolicibacterium poriferae]|uniref:Uncharacterized protein n=1 Tax=Mycolicibacterium poriferae TaxID=39694 RepID=A0A6N4V8B2_9MYCO|nr:hypothetical protein MPOR_18770 [Mycolicibacterium poriferae]